MEGKFWPGHRFKIRELAAAMGVSETPVREAVMQLVREKGLEMKAAKSITVAQLSLAQYLELRDIRLHLEGMASEVATSKIDNDTIQKLHRFHEELIKAEDEGRWPDALLANWKFHHTIYRAAEMPELLALIEGIWLRNGPLVNFQYPHARPTYPGKHQHLNVLSALGRRDPVAVRQAMQNDLKEGGVGLVRLLEKIESGEIDSEDLRREAAGNVKPEPDRAVGSPALR
ncbi:DNA-binding GntR family transcriptional regulator [Mesorhizobium sp. J18]|nr:DNA-binding GntR family transcriptional regulator [Mesorhizobium sp. J18]